MDIIETKNVAEEEKRNRATVNVYNYRIANNLLQFGFKLLRIIPDYKKNDFDRPVFVFKNEDGIMNVITGLREKIRSNRINKEEEDNGE